MGAFEVQDTTVEPMHESAGSLDCNGGGNGGGGKLKDECIVAHKVYDSCRRQNCLTVNEIGPALVEEDVDIDGTQIAAGTPVIPPSNAVSVTMDTVHVKAITIVDKQPSPFRAGFWDIDIKYDMIYNLSFRDSAGCVTTVKAMSVFGVKTTMFGSISSEVTIVTDMYKDAIAPVISSAPFVWAEAKCLGLDAKIVQGAYAKEVQVTIGLFCIVKLFRLVHLNVQSKGFCIPKECKEQGKINPCEYFDHLDFPMDIFAPPQKREFHAGISENIPRESGY